MTLPDFTPRYYEIEQQLRSRLAVLRTDDPLPSDAMLCAEFGVSRMTARNAMQRLVQEGLVVRVPGRGSFVAQRPVDRQLSNLRGFSEEMRARGLRPSSTALSAALRPAAAEEAHVLRLPHGSEVVVVERVRLADGIPMALERAVLTPSCAGVLDLDLASGSLHAAMVSVGVVPDRGESSVTAQTAGAADSRHLQVATRSALLVERRLIHDRRSTPVEWTESRYVPDRYVLTVEFTVELPGRRPSRRR